MTTRVIRAIIFDLGNTLMIPVAPWDPVLAQADQALSDALCQMGLNIDCKNFHHDFRTRLQDYYIQRDQDFIETTYLWVLGELLAERGYEHVPFSVLRTALDQLYAITQANWVLEEHAHTVLQSLQQEGFVLGIISNAGDDNDVAQLVERFQIDRYFDFVLTSASCGYRKPHRRIFELGLAHWQYSPHQTIMVGDSLDADIRGANKLGMHSVWIQAHAMHTRGEYPDVIPDTVLQSLGDLPGFLRAL